jgi:hypothetical protein
MSNNNNLGGTTACAPRLEVVKKREEKEFSFISEKVI